MSKAKTTASSAESNEHQRTISSMHNRYGRILQFIFKRLFHHIEYPSEAALELKTLAEQGTIVYVTRGRSPWLALYLNYSLPTAGLPLARYVAGINMVLWQPVTAIWRYYRHRNRSTNTQNKNKEGTSLQSYQEEQLTRTVSRNQAALLIFKAGQRSGQRRDSKHRGLLRALINLQTNTETPIFLIPHILTDRGLGGNTGLAITNRIFGEKRHAGTLRELAHRVATTHTARVRAGRAINLAHFINEHTTLTTDDLALKLSHTLNRQLSDEERVVAGPQLLSHDMVRRNILRSAQVRNTIQQISEESGRPTTSLENEVGRYVDQIAARYSARALRIVAYLVALIMNRIYDGMVTDKKGLAQVIKHATQGPLVFCPAHRSHIDYLALSFLLWQYGVTPPHIAAGANLSFFPLGPIFRACGAFFMRRSFRQAPLYAAVFKAYVAELVRHGIAIEFFVEGTRTRTGKLLMPRFGLLSMLVAAWRDKAKDDILFVPVSVDYERIIEAASYHREIKGAEKQKEDLGALIKTSKVLRSKFGRLHLQFGSALSLKAFAEKHKLPQSAEPEYDEAWRRGIAKLGFVILHNVANVVTITPTSLAALVLIGHSHRGIAKSDMLTHIRTIIDFLDASAARFSDPLKIANTREDAVLEAIERLIDDGLVTVDRPGRTDAEPIYHVPERNRVELDMLKNALMNHFAPGALVARALLKYNQPTVACSKIRHDVSFLAHLLKREFIFRGDTDFEAAFDESLATLAVRGIIDVNEDETITVQNPDMLQLLSGFLDSLLECYWVTGQSLEALKQFPLWDKEVINHAMEKARRCFLAGQTTRPESASRVTISSALTWMEDTHVLESRRSGKRRTLLLTQDYAGRRLEELVQNIESYL